MGKVVELTVSKGKTVKAGDRDEWLKVEYAVKAAVDDQGDLEAAKAHLEGLLDGWLTNLAVPAVTPKPQEAANKPGPELFPEDLRQLLSFTEQDGFLIVKPRQFLGVENFSKIMDIVKGHGGAYMSAGKDSHFRIPLKEADGRW